MTSIRELPTSAFATALAAVADTVAAARCFPVGREVRAAFPFALGGAFPPFRLFFFRVVESWDDEDDDGSSPADDASGASSSS